MKFVVGFSLFITAIVFPSVAQETSKPFAELITEQVGLPKRIFNIIQDKQGYIWLCSTQGLTRYDGYTFEYYQHIDEDSTSLPSNFIVKIKEDARGNIWCGHLRATISKFNPISKKTESYVLDPSSEQDITMIHHDKKGQVWAGLKGSGLYKLTDQNKFEFVGAVPNLPTKGEREANWYNTIYDIYEAPSGIFWIATMNGLCAYNPATNTFSFVNQFEQNPNDAIESPATLYNILSLEPGELWISTFSDGLIKYEIDNNSWKRFLFQEGPKGTTNIVPSITRKSDHEILVGSAGKGYGVFNVKTQKFSFFNDHPESGLSVYATLVDRNQIQWISTDVGLYKINPANNFFHFNEVKVNHSDNGSYYFVSDVITDVKSTKTIIGTELGDGLHIIGVNEEKILNFKISHPFLEVADIHQDKIGNIWVATRDYFFQLENNLLKQVHIFPESFNDSGTPAFQKIAEAQDGSLWIATRFAGLIRYTPSTQEVKIYNTQNSKIPTNALIDLVIDQHDRIWIAHHKQGLSVFENNAFKTFKYVKNQRSIASDLVTSLALSNDQKLWISTLDGLTVLNTKNDSVEHPSLFKSPYSAIMYSVAVDQDENIWAVSSNELLFFNRENNQIKKFTSGDGLVGDNTFFKLRSGSEGSMLVLSTQGYYKFYPEEILKPTQQAPLVITSLMSGAQELTTTGVAKVLLPHNQNNLFIEFASLNFLPRNKNLYQYKMEGLENDWSGVSTNNIVNYSSLPPGDYMFKVRLINDTAPDESQEIQLPIKITPPFWKTWWFYYFIVLCILGLVFLIYKLRLNQVRKEAELKNEFTKQLAEVEMKALRAQMSPHFIFNSLNSINRYIVKSDPQTASLYLTKFSKLIRLILDNSNNKIVSLDQELQAIKLYIELEALRFNNKFDYQIKVNENLSTLAIGLPPMIIQPFVENAIWHGLLHKDEPGLIKILIEPYESGIQCIIEDNGVGRIKAQELKSKSIDKGKSYGMKISKDRLSLLNGSTSVNSTIEIIDLMDHEGNARGTKVILRILTTEMELDF